MKTNSSATCHSSLVTRHTLAELSPLVLALALSLRVRSAFGECMESVSRIVAHLRAQIAHQLIWSRNIKSIDDELERDYPLFQRALANDPAPIRRRLLADLRRLHHRTETLSATVDPKCPMHLLADASPCEAQRAKHGQPHLLAD